MKFGSFFESAKIVPRPQQQMVLDTMSENIDKYNYFILSLPTGVGKTFLACDIAATVGSTYILTSSIQLQDQYEKSWNDIVSLKGKSNYLCNVNRNFTCATAPCNHDKSITAGCMQTGKCAYYNQRSAALASKAFITNPSYFLNAAYHGVLSDAEDSKRSIMVVDEAHLLENALVSFAEISITIPDLQRKLAFVKELKTLRFNEDIFNNITQLKLLKGYLEASSEKIAKSMEVYTSSESDSKDTNWMKKVSKEVTAHLKDRQHDLQSVNDFLLPLKLFTEDTVTDHELSEKWVINYNPVDKSIYLAPLYGGQVFKHLLEPRASKFVFMSATIGDKTEFCKELNIPFEETMFIETDTPFDPEKSPVKVIPVLKMGYKDINETLNHVGDIMGNLLDHHKDEKGIIHCATYKLQHSIYTQLESEHQQRVLCRDMRILSEGSKLKVNNDTLVNIHTSSNDATVLLSPSMNEGISLDDDLSRFQVITKLPWGSLGNPRIKKKSTLNSNWYSNHMWNTVMQAAGRSTRNEDDNSITYILDASFKFFYSKWQSKLPTWFKDRIAFYDV